MKHFLIKYRFKIGSEDVWHGEIKRFIAAIEGDPSLKGRIGYLCMKASGPSEDYYHIATAADEEAVKALQGRAFFAHYTSESKRVSDGAIEVVPLTVIAETAVLA
jgi:hypothetical protein